MQWCVPRDMSCAAGALPLPHPACCPPVAPFPFAVLANSGEVFSSLPSALPTFDQWLNYSAGVNINKTIAVSALWAPEAWH